MLVDASDVCREKNRAAAQSDKKIKNSSSFSKNIKNLKSCEKRLTLTLNECIINNVKSVITF